MASAAVRFKAVDLLLTIHCLLLLPLFVPVCDCVWCSTSVLSSFAIVSLRKRESWLLCFNP